MRLYVLDGGILKTTKDKMLFSTDVGKPFDIPVPFYYLEIGKEKVMIDGGMSPGCVTDPEKTWGDIINVYYPVLTEENTAVGQLGKMGVDPEEITTVIMTHLHLDHTGSLKEFKNARVYVQLDELRYAFWPDPFMAGSYIREDIIIPKIDWKPIVGVTIFFDGKITTLPTKGHTPGHQSVVLRLKAGTVVLAGDAIYLTPIFIGV